MRLWDLINEVKEKDEFLGEWMKGLWANVDQYLNDCIHGNNQYLNLYLNKETRTLEGNIPEDLMAFMLDLTNSVALGAALQMREVHTQDERISNLFNRKLSEYLDFTTELLEPIFLHTGK